MAASFKIRFTLALAGSGRQAPARCVEVAAGDPLAAIARIVEHYAARGKTPRPYTIEIDGVWRKIEWREEIAQTIPGAPRRYHLTIIRPVVGAAIAAPIPIAIERPRWAGGVGAPPPVDKLARMGAMVEELAPTPSGPEAARIMADLRKALAQDASHRLEGRFKKLKALARAEGLWNRED